MSRFLVRRLLQALATLLVISIVTFLLGALAPGSPIEARFDQHAHPAAIAAAKKRYGLDQPLPVRYWRWISGIPRGDLGISYRYDRPVAELLARRFPVTLRLGLMAAGLALLIGIALGVVAAARSGTWVDQFATSLSLAGVSIPTFVLLPLLVLALAVRGRWFPVTYERQEWHLLLPAFALALRPAAMLARMTRASLLDALSQDYVRTAIAKGASRWRALLAHAGRNALAPIITVFGSGVGYLLGGSFVVETIYAVPGIGDFSIISISYRDYPLIQAVTLLAAAVFLLVNLLVDLAYGLLDPRLRTTA